MFVFVVEALVVVAVALLLLGEGAEVLALAGFAVVVFALASALSGDDFRHRVYVWRYHRHDLHHRHGLHS